MDGYIDRDGLVEVKGIEPHYWLDLRKIEYLCLAISLISVDTFPQILVFH